MTKPLEALIADMKAAALKADKGPYSIDETGYSLNSRQGTFADFLDSDNATFSLEANPENTLALIAALEQSQREMDDLLPSSRNMLMPVLDGLSRDDLVAVIQTAVNNYSALYRKWLDAGEGIADLEAREFVVVLHKRSVGEVMHMSGFSRDYAEGWCAGNDNAIHEICAAGGTVGGE